jgi:3-phenylpropionate/cinnamic acid dioxygenase small subunit
MNGMREAAQEVLLREALYLDTQRWDEWLALFCEDCEYWVPAWKSEHEPTADPKSELSLIYYASRGGLEDRVWRVRSNRSVASKPVPRTQHIVSNILIDGPQRPDRIQVKSNWTVHQFKLKSRDVELLFGRCEHELVLRDGRWLIKRRTALLLNDYMPAMLDFYSF